MIVPRTVRLLAALIIPVLVVGVGGAAILLRAHAATPPIGQSGVDSRLILRPHTIAVTGRLANDLPFRFTIYPTLPGSNTVRVALPAASGRHSHVTIVATMIGMAMTPSRASLVDHGGVFVGSVNLPMFGRYRLTVISQLQSARQAGHVTVVLPLP
jgi:hypothetical protein